MTKKETSEKFRKSRKGIVSTTFNHQKERSKRRDHEQPKYTKEELEKWFYNQSNFETLYNNWVNSNYNMLLKPSVDRLDDSKGYNFNNIQLITWKENQAKGLGNTKNIKYYETNSSIRGNFKKACDKKGLKFEDFKEIESGEKYRDKRKYFYKKIEEGDHGKYNRR